MTLYMIAITLTQLTGHVWRVIGDVHGVTAVCQITRHGLDLWANGCWR